MKAFIASLAALVVITVGANQVLQYVNYSSERAAVSDQNVRLD